MKQFQLFFSLLFLLFVVKITAQTSQNYRIVENDADKIKIAFSTGDIQYQNVKTTVGMFTRLTMENFHSSSAVGNPVLPVMVNMVEIPLCEEV
ncbi:MAG: C25 family peptidase propeptide domain-containing protein, partial [Bacteroidales bacterium]